VPNFAEIAKPLTALTRKDRQFTWGLQQQQAFQSMKDRLCTTPVLGYPNFELPFIITTDASKVAIAANLSQVQDRKERSIAYASRQLNTAEQNYTASEQEMLALVWATRYFRCYLYGKRFLVRTDHAALTYLQKFPDHDSCLLRWFLKQSELDFVVEHRAGFKIGRVDALCRHVGVITNPDPLSRGNVQQEQRKMLSVADKTQGVMTVRVNTSWIAMTSCTDVRKTVNIS